MNAALILLAIGIAGVVLATSWVRRGRCADLGTVSDHWISEQRLGQDQNPQR